MKDSYGNEPTSGQILIACGSGKTRWTDPHLPKQGTWTIRIDRGLLDRLLETGRLEIPGAAGLSFAIELKDGPPANLLNAELVEAARGVLECHIGPIMSDEKYRALTRALDDLRDSAGRGLLK